MAGTLTLEEYNALSREDLERWNADEYGEVGGRLGDGRALGKSRTVVYVRGGGVAVTNPQRWCSMTLPEPEDVCDAGESVSSDDDDAIRLAGEEERRLERERVAERRRRRRAKSPIRETGIDEAA